MSLYKRLRISTSILRLADGALIPDDPRNADYREYLEWVAKGNTPDPADPAPPPTQDELDLADAKAYAKLVRISAMTPAQIRAEYTANVKTLAQAIDAQATLAIAVALMFRRMQ